jgi:ribosomal protein S12 methylthiotransferase accessory factor
MPAAIDRLRLDRLVGLWDYLVDDKVGVVQEVHELPTDDDDPNFFHYLSRSCDTGRFTPLSNFRNNGGVSVDRYVAVAKALGEAVERYCSAIFRYDDLLLAPYSALEGRATPPDAFALYRAEQFASEGFQWQPFTPESKVHWAKGVSLVTGEETLLPAAMVYVPYHYVLSREDTPICQPISTGLALGCSFEEAALSGLCEVVERDAFTLTWHARISHPRINPASLPESGRDILRRYADVGLEVRLMDITTDVRFPTVMTIALSDSTTSPAVAVAAATDPSAETAMLKSLEELAHTRKFAKQLMEYTPPIPVDVERGFPQVLDQRHHLRFYCPQEAKKYIEFAWASPEVRDFDTVVDASTGDARRELNALVQGLRQAGLDPIACDLTTPDIAGLGLRVVRAVVPGMHPLFMGHRNRALGGRRLYEVPQKLGHRGLQRGEADNPYPHPFP